MKAAELNKNNSTPGAPSGKPLATERGQGAVIFAIESSCDETSAAVCGDGKILSNFIANQKVHEKYGGGVSGPAKPGPPQNTFSVFCVSF